MHLGNNVLHFSGWFSLRPLIKNGNNHHCCSSVNNEQLHSLLSIWWKANILIDLSKDITVADKWQLFVSLTSHRHFHSEQEKWKKREQNHSVPSNGITVATCLNSFAFWPKKSPKPHPKMTITQNKCQLCHFWGMLAWKGGFDRSKFLRTWKWVCLAKVLTFSQWWNNCVNLFHPMIKFSPWNGN